MQLIRELKRRNVFRVGAAYIALAWLVVQVAETLVPAFELDPAVLRVIIITAAIGFIPALVVSWLFELTPDGLRPDDGVDEEPGYTRLTKERLNRIIITALALAVTVLAIDRFVLSTEGSAPVTADVSIAVLPFVNLSDADEMVFFSDGVAEDILGLLSHTRGLRCIARSSSFALRDPEIPASVVGERLEVDYVLTGTLRHHNNTVRVNVRLVETETESLVWSQNYDRNLDDVFAIQDDISRQVVDAVAPALTASHTSAATTSADDYITYLKARHIYIDGRDDNDVEKILAAKAMLTDLIAENPNYARAHAGLADVWSGLAIIGAVSTEEGYENAKASALRALEIDPDSADAWYALGDIRVEYDWDLRAAKDAYDRALAIAPSDADGLRGYAYFLRQAGRIDEALAVYNETRALDPLSQRAFIGLYFTYLHGGRLEEAEQMIDQVATMNPRLPSEAIKAQIYAQRQEYERINALLPQIREFHPVFLQIYLDALSQRGLGNADKGNETIAELTTLSARAAPLRFFVARYYAEFGDNDLAIRYLDEAVAEKEIGLGEALTVPQMAALREDPQFWEWVERAGIVPLD